MNYKKNKSIFMMFAFMMLVVAVFCNKSVTANAMVEKDLSDYNDNQVVDITEDTILYINTSKDLKGINVSPYKKLIIKDKGSGHTLYTGGRVEGNIRYAGINVPNNAVLIIDINDNKLVAVGGASIEDVPVAGSSAYASAAGIGGNGYRIDNYTDYSYISCGIVIINSGKIFACGGCSWTGQDVYGTGAGIGGGGYAGKTPRTGGFGGNIYIYGGNILAIGGGTTNRPAGNIYRYCVNELSRTYTEENLTWTGYANAYGTGAGIGGGGTFYNGGGGKDVNFTASVHCAIYGGRLTTMSGVGMYSNNIYGQGASIGDGGVCHDGGYDPKGHNESLVYMDDKYQSQKTETEIARDDDVSTPNMYNGWNDYSSDDHWLYLYRGGCGVAKGAYIIGSGRTKMRDEQTRGGEGTIGKFNPVSEIPASPFVGISYRLGEGTYQSSGKITRSNNEKVTIRFVINGNANMLFVYDYSLYKVEIGGTTEYIFDFNKTITKEYSDPLPDKIEYTITNVFGLTTSGTFNVSDHILTITPPSYGDVQYAASNTDSTTWYNTETDVLNEFDDLETLKTIYVKVTATSTGDVTDMGIDGFFPGGGDFTPGGKTGTYIFYTTGNGTVSVKSTAGEKESTKDITINAIGSYGTKVVPPPTLTYGYSLSSDPDGTWYESEEELYNNTEDIVDMNGIYVKVTAESPADNDNSKNIDDISATGVLAPASGSSGIGTKKAYAMFIATGNGTYSCTATVGGTDKDKTTNGATKEITHHGDEGAIIVKPPEVTISCCIDGVTYTDIEKITYAPNTKEPTVWPKDEDIVKLVRRRGPIKIKVTATDPRGIKEIILNDTQIEDKGGAETESSEKIYTIESTTTFLQDTTFKYTVNSSCSPKKFTTGQFLLEKYIEQEVSIEGEGPVPPPEVKMTVVLVSGFKPYLIDGKTVLKFKITYGEEFLDTSKLTIIKAEEPGVETGVNTVYEVNTGNTDKSATGLTYKIHYIESEETETINYTIDQALATANKDNIVSIANGNITVSNVSVYEFSSKTEKGKEEVTFGKTVGDKESTMPNSSNEIIITGTSTDYTVTVNSTQPKTLKIDNLSITSGSKAPILVKASTTATIKMQGSQDCTLTVNGKNNSHAGIEVEDNAKLTVSSCSKTLKITNEGRGAGIGTARDASATGATIKVTDGALLNIEMKKADTGEGAGIGSGDNGKIGAITISGGKITTTGKYGAGIGSGYKGTSGTITISGGTIIPTGTYGAGIGSSYGGTARAITITGGEIKAIPDLGSGIGSGYKGTVTGAIKISGKTKIETTTGGAAGIGCGYRGKLDGTITIDIDTTDTTKYYIKTISVEGAGIGSGMGGVVTGTITIKGGKITTTKQTDEDGNLLGGGAGIGSGSKWTGSSDETIANTGDIIISGGKIAIDVKDGAGIGSGRESSSGAITIEGGTITTTSEDGAGVGSGSNGTSGAITIKGGKVTPASEDGAGVGSGYYGTSGAITISGGTVTPTSTGGAGVGSGSYGTSGAITISGGTVTTTSTTGAGVGSGRSGRSGNISITGGTIKTTSTTGAGIGSGKDADNNTATITINITTGSVTTTSTKGAGVGAGNYGKCGKIEIKKGSVTTKRTTGDGAGVGSGSNGINGVIAISGGTVTTTSMDGAGIGSGREATTGNISITGGTIKTTSTTGAGIGSGKDADNSTATITINITTGSVTTTSTEGAGVGAGNYGKCGKIEIKKGSVTTKRTTGDGAGVGSGSNGTNGEIAISGGTVTTTSMDGAGVGSGSSGTSGAITISGGTLIQTSKGGGAGVGAGSSGTSGAITISEGTITITNTGYEGAGIGAGNNATSGNINISNGTIKISVNTSTGIGAGASGKTGTINITGGTVEVTFTIGAGTGIGSGRWGQTGDILITTCDITMNGDGSIGIGSESDKAAENITIQGADLDISGVRIGIGTRGGYKIGDITIQKDASSGRRSKVKAIAVYVGIGGQEGTESKVTAVGDISISDSDVEAKSYNSEAIGCGKYSSMGNISITNSNIKADAQKTAIGSDSGSTEGTISITNSNVEANSTYSGTAIGAGNLSKIGDISINSGANIVVSTYQSEHTGIGAGASGTCGAISIISSKVQASSCKVGIGCGDSGTVKSIIIVSCNPIIVSASTVGIGKYAGTSTDMGNILINDSAVKVSGIGDSKGVGIGSTNSNLNGIFIYDSIVNAITNNISTEGAAIGGHISDDNKIEIRNSKVITSTNGAVGIGGTGTNMDVDIFNSKLDISNSGNGTGIGTNNGTIRDITLNKCGAKINSTYTAAEGAGIGSGAGTVEGTITINDSELSVYKPTRAKGAGIGSGTNGSVNNISIDGSKVVARSEYGAGIGSGYGTAKVIGTITINNGIVIATSAKGAGIGSGYGKSSTERTNVANIVIQDSKVNTSTDDGGAGIGSGYYGDAGNITITNSDIASKVSSSGASIGTGAYGGVTGTITINSGNIDAVSNGGSAIGVGTSGTVNEIVINGGNIEAVAGVIGAGTGSGIEANNITIKKGVHKFYGKNGLDIKGTTIYIKGSANARAYNNNVQGTIARTEGGGTLTQQKLTTDLLRNVEETATIKDITGTTTIGIVQTDENGDIYFWAEDGEKVQVDVNGLRFITM